MSHAETLLELLTDPRYRVQRSAERLLDVTRGDYRRAISQATCWASNESSRTHWIAVAGVLRSEAEMERRQVQGRE